MAAEVGIITEVGDLGLGYDALSEADQAKLEKQNQKENEDNKGAK